MSNFGDAEKLAAARELQRSFSTRVDAPRGGRRVIGPRRGQAANSRAQLSATATRNDYQDTSYLSTRGGRGGIVTPRARNRDSVTSSAARSRNIQRNPSTRNVSHASNFTTDGFTQGVASSQLSTGFDGNKNYDMITETNAQQDKANTPTSSRGLGTSRFAEEVVTPGAAATPRLLQQDERPENTQRVTLGRFVGYYQDLNDELEFVPDGTPANVKGVKGLQTSRFATPVTRSSFSADDTFSTMTRSTTELDQSNPRYEGFYQDVDQAKPLSATQNSNTLPAMNQAHSQHAGPYGAHPNIPHFNLASASPANASGLGVSAIQHASAETHTLPSTMHPALRESLDLYMQLTAQGVEDDAMEVDEEL